MKLPRITTELDTSDWAPSECRIVCVPWASKRLYEMAGIDIDDQTVTQIIVTKHGLTFVLESDDDT